MGEKKYLQEFECDWIANIEGAIYSDTLVKMEDKKQLTRVPYDPSLPVNTSWDLGVSDHSSIIFFQQLGRYPLTHRSFPTQDMPTFRQHSNKVNQSPGIT